MYCSVLQCVAACCSVLQCVLQCVAVYIRDSVKVWRSDGLVSVAACCSALQRVAVRCNVLQCVAVCHALSSRTCDRASGAVFLGVF